MPMDREFQKKVKEVEVEIGNFGKQERLRRVLVKNPHDFTSEPIKDLFGSVAFFTE